MKSTGLKNIPFRVTPELHQQLRIAVAEQGITFQKMLEMATRDWLARRRPKSDIRKLAGLLRDSGMDAQRADDRAIEQRREDRLVYPLTNEPWGVRRFFVTDPNGIVINVMSHIGGTKSD